jgi:hypothetical protein
MPPSGGAKLHSQKYGLLPLIVACNPHSQSIEIHGCVSFKRAGQVDNVFDSPELQYLRHLVNGDRDTGASFEAQFLSNFLGQSALALSRDGVSVLHTSMVG